MKQLRLQHYIVGILIAILGLIVLHAPLTVFVQSRWPQTGDVVKGWKEVLILLSLVLTMFHYTKERAWWMIRRDAVVWCTGAYAIIHGMSVLLFPTTTASMIAGSMIDLRYVAYFVVVYSFLKLHANYRRYFLTTGLIGAVIVTGFAVLQLVLPVDFLTHIGYGDATIQPYLTVDKNPDYVRLQSTLRGPNPLGAYAIIVLASAIGYILSSKQQYRYGAIGITLASIIALWCSYSRSALIAFGVVVLCYAWRIRHRYSIRLKIIVAVIAVVVAAVSMTALQGTSFWHNVVVHDNPSTGGSIDSNQGHADSLRDGISRMIVQPLGAGVGSTGSASLYGHHPLIIENHYLFVAHEVGWMGLILYLTLYGIIMRQLYRGRSDWRCFAMFSSGVGLALIGLMQPVWADDTVSIVWWGLAAAMYDSKGGSHGAATNKKAKRIA